MRYIGNKRKLIPFIRDAIEELGIDGTTACDPFAGTAAVGRFLKESGYGVVCGDILSFSYALQRTYVVLDEAPRFRGLADLLPASDEPARAAIRHLNGLPGRQGFMARHFAPNGRPAAHDRRYFTPENAARIDAVRHTIEAWAADGRITDEERYYLITALLEAADRVANTTGIYAAYVKSWQPNAKRPLRLRMPRITRGDGRPCRAYRGEALELVRDLPRFDLLYLDPPYNTRQYAGYYHIPEIIAEGWFDGEPELRGKTGLPPDAHKRSDWSRSRDCEAAFRALVQSARCRHILMSYNSEGIIPEETIEATFRAVGRPGSFRRLGRPYRRYRSDSDGPDRRYRADRVTERLYYAQVTDA